MHRDVEGIARRARLASRTVGGSPVGAPQGLGASSGGGRAAPICIVACVCIAPAAVQLYIYTSLHPCVWGCTARRHHHHHRRRRAAGCMPRMQHRSVDMDACRCIEM